MMPPISFLMGSAALPVLDEFCDFLANAFYPSGIPDSIHLERDNNGNDERTPLNHLIKETLQPAFNRRS